MLIHHRLKRLAATAAVEHLGLERAVVHLFKQGAVEGLADEFLGLAGELEYKGRQTGLVLDIGGYYKNVITFAPSLHISSEEIDQGLALLDQLLTKAKRA